MLHESASGGIPADLACSGTGKKGGLGLWMALDDENKDEFWTDLWINKSDPKIGPPCRVIWILRSTRRRPQRGVGFIGVRRRGLGGGRNVRGKHWVGRKA